MKILSRPKTWEEITRLLWSRSIDEYDRYRPRIAYRGLSKKFSDLSTGIQRIGGPSVEYPLMELQWRERRIIETFSTYATESLPENFTDWDVILLGQNNSLPTRLLNWSSSPYVALFFATHETSYLDQDGIIWCVSRVETNSKLPKKMKGILESKRSRIFYLDTLKSAFPKGLQQLDKQISSNSLIWFEPPSINTRITNQFGIYSFMGSVDASHSSWLSNNQEFCWGIVVPAELKREIRQRLQVLNITERTMFGGLEGTAKWLKSFYG